MADRPNRRQRRVMVSLSPATAAALDRLRERDDVTMTALLCRLIQAALDHRGEATNG